MIITLCKKELRENLLVALIGLLAVLLHVSHNVRLEQDTTYSSWSQALSFFALMGNLYYYGNETPIPIVMNRFLGLFTGIGYVMAVVLGFMMTCREDIRHTWAFLIHRPVTRYEILISKIATGSFLYLIPMTIPFLILSVWCAHPGHYPAPWTNEFLIPGFEKILQGYILFLASFLCGIRQARWYMSRLFPLLSIFGLMMTIGIVNRLILAGALYGLVVYLLLLAIVHVFICQTVSRRVILSGLIGFGFLAFAGIVATLVTTIFFLSVEPDRVDFQFSKEGEAQMLLWDKDEQNYTIQSLDGEVIAVGVEEGSTNIISLVIFYDQTTSTNLWEWRPGTRMMSVDIINTWDSDYPFLSYVLWNQSRLVSYHRYHRSVIGYWGISGFESQIDQTIPFPHLLEAEYNKRGGKHDLYVKSENGLYLIDEAKRLVTMVMNETVYNLAVGTCQRK